MNDRGEKTEGEDSVDTEALTTDIHQIYLYYIKFNSSGQYQIRAYEYFHGDIPIPNPEIVIKERIAIAIQDTNPQDTSFDDFHRERKGIVVLALDGAVFRTDRPVDFKCDRAKERSAKGNDGTHTFLPGPRFEETISGHNISVVTRRYEAKKSWSAGDLEQHEWEHFRIKLFGTIPGRAGEEIVEDSGGTNMGPPPRPPGFLPGPGLA